MSIIGTILWTNNAWAVNGTEWTTAKGGGRECAPISPGQMCYWAVNTTGQSPALTKRCGKISLRSTDGEALTADVYVCEDTVFANCAQLEAVNRRTGAYGDVALSDTDWGVINIPFGNIVVNVTSAGTCGSPDCYIITECSEY